MKQGQQVARATRVAEQSLFMVGDEGVHNPCNKLLSCCVVQLAAGIFQRKRESREVIDISGVTGFQLALE